MKALIEISNRFYAKVLDEFYTHADLIDGMNAIRGGQPLPDDCEILTKEAYSDLCMRASKGNCSEIPTGSEKLSSALEKNSKKLEKDFGELDCISRADARSLVVKIGRKDIPSMSGKTFQDLYKGIDELPSVTPQEPRCKDCKWWKDSDGEYRRGCGAESRCPINRREVFEGNGYCYLFEPQKSEDKE